MPWSQQHSPDLGSDSLLAESAQLRSTLQAKTYLQALSPDERRRLLKGTKVSGHRRKHHTSAVAAAAARRDELQQLLEQEKDRVIGDQAVLAQQANVSYSSRPAAHETAAWETARLRVRATSMAAENDALKNHVAQLMHQISNMDRSIQVVSNEARARSQRMTEAAAARIAELEDQVERQQRALGEMAAASEELARDNCTVSDEVVQLREDKASQAQNMDALQDRVAKLQELYMRDLDQSKALTIHEGIQQSNLLQLATPEMLALSQPPAYFRLEEDARSTHIVPALHEIEGLRRERKTLKDQVKSKSEKLACAEQANAELSTQLTAERRAAKQAGAGAQKQLLGSMRRIQYMVSKAKDSEAAMQQKDAYIRKLEARLLNQHKAPANKAKSGVENSNVGSGSFRRSSPSTANAASKQDQLPAASSPFQSQSGSKHSEAAAQPQHFSYQVFPQPLQDTSNLPSNAPFSRQHRPASAPLHKPSTAGELWQNDHPSRSSSGCFSMDPAQLEADIAALTSAIAADSAAEGLLRHPRHMDHASSHVRPANDDIGVTHQDELYQEQYQGHMHLEPEFQTSTQGMQPEQQQHWHQTGRSDGKAHGQVASTRAAPAVPAVRLRHVHDQPVGLAGQDDQRVAQNDSWDLQNAEASAGSDNPVWHGRQNKDERLADAAESRLLGLAAKPTAGVHSTQQDLEPRHHRPVSYARRGVQEPSGSRRDLDGVQPLYQSSQIVSNEYAEPNVVVPGTMGMPQQDRGHVMVPAGSNAASREMLRAALHNLALHDDSPPSSTSQQSGASSLHSIDHSPPTNSITANNCFDAAALFANTSSASLNPTGQIACSPQTIPEAAQANTAMPKVHQLQQQCLDDADSIQSVSMARLAGQGIQGEMQHAKQCQHPHQLHQQLPRQVPQQVPAELLQQQSEEVSSQRSVAQNRLQRPAHLPAESPSQEAVQSQQAPQLQHDSGLPASASVSRDDSGEELMTLEELEARIATLNKTLLRAPEGLQSPQAASSHAIRTRLGRCQLDLEQHQLPGGIKCHASETHSHGIEAQDAGQVDRPAMTAWQKLTSRRPAPAVSSESSPSSRGSQGRSAAKCGASHIDSTYRSPQTMRGRGVQAAPLESPPSTGMRHYSAASKHRSEDWDGSDCRLLDWAASCSQGSSSQLSYKSEQASRAQQGTHARPPASAGGSSSCSTDAGRPLTMLRSPAAMLPSRHLPPNTASSCQAMQARLSPVAASWRLYNNVDKVHQSQ
ncbi:TPA: hypothetical protein ACH3X1_000916 [Trebouxia sp. C0004]